MTEMTGAEPTVRELVDALPRAIVVTDGAGRVVVWNRKAAELYGWTEGEVVGKTAPEVLAPIDPPDASSELLGRVLAGEPFTGDVTILTRTGEPRRIHSALQPVLDEDGSVLWVVGASEDVSDLRVVEQRSRDLTERLCLALDAAGLGTWRGDKATGEVTWDERMEALFGFAPGAFDGTFEAYQAALHPADRESVLATVTEAVERRGSYRLEHRVAMSDGTERWIQGAGTVTVGPDGTVTGAIGCSMDVTDRVGARLAIEETAASAQRAVERERIDRERFEFVAAINVALADALTREQIMAAVTQAAVARLGDWCSIYVLRDPDDRVPDVETFHIDPQMVDYARRLTERFPFDPDAATGMAAVMRTGRTEFRPEITPAVIEDVLGELDVDQDDAAELRDVLSRLQLRSSIAVPLIKHGRILGGLSFATTSSRRAYTDDDVVLAHVVAGRVASSLENRRLSDQQRQIAMTLQASLLPESLPAVAGLDVAVRYWAAGESAVVGGDFYDLFEIEPGRWAAVIGDVCGTGPKAAALTSMARHTIRQAAWRGDEPDEVVEWLNRSMIANIGSAASFLTIAYLTLVPTTNGFAVTVTRAGHPPPVHVHAHGRARALGSSARVVGVFDRVNGRTEPDSLAPGDTIVLYTDGLTDLPPPNDLDTAQTVELIGRAVSTGGGQADGIATRLQHEVEQRRLLQDRADDIAIVVLHATAR